MPAVQKEFERAVELLHDLHAMDYLVYAYLQAGRDREADEVVQQLGRPAA